MIRGRDNKGNVIIGITRVEIDGLVAGHRCCFPNHVPEAAGPHICLWFAEDDDGLIARALVWLVGRPASDRSRVCGHPLVPFMRRWTGL